MKKHITTIAAIATALISAGHAFAADDLFETRTVRVTFVDLDLSREGGRAALDARIRMAVSHVCPLENNADLDQVARSAKCRDAALAGARQQLVAIYASREFAVASVAVHAPR